MGITVVPYNRLSDSQGFSYANIGVNMSTVPSSGNYSQNGAMFSSIVVPQVGNHNPTDTMFGSVL